MDRSCINIKNDKVIPRYISHIRLNTQGECEYQSNEEHSLGVAELARQFADEFDMGDYGYAMGMMHDKGKEKNEFQNYIRFENGMVNEKSYTQTGKSHAYVGGLIAQTMGQMVAPLVVNPIMGHHRGLYDYFNVEEALKKQIPIEVGGVTLPKPDLPVWIKTGNMQQKDFHHVERMLYSCLVDADYLDTERFMQPGQFAARGGKQSLHNLLPKLQTYLEGLGKPETEVNRIRAKVQTACEEKSTGIPGFYSLTVPTGGGKTLASLVWAMKHAVHYGKKRIIIAIPYTSIIVQTAGILRKIFGDENVLEHHSNVVIDDSVENETARQLQLATENWDYPIIVTTNVQLFESMMSSRPSECRKLHNICNSVLILDEVQNLPTDFLQPIVDSLDTYHRIFGISVLFTTASQPVLEGKHHGTNPGVVLNGLKHIEEIIPDGWKLYERLRRVNLEIDDAPKTYDEVADMLKRHDRVLCIVNTRRDAKELFDRLPDDGIRIHLSRMMCPAHVSEKICEMKKALSDTNNKVVRVISTQLIEAGVDIDFPVVYRQEAGLDSILQAAGRCNREGKLPICTTYVFSLSQEHALPRGFITQCNNARLNMSKNYDLFSPEAMVDYFHQLYSRIQSFDKQDMKYYLYNIEGLMFETAAQQFRLIDDSTTSVVVNWGEGLSLAEDLKMDGPSYALMKRLGHYSVNVRNNDLYKMIQCGIVEEIRGGIYVANCKGQYSADVGLLTDNQWLEEVLIK